MRRCSPSAYTALASMVRSASSTTVWYDASTTRSAPTAAWVCRAPSGMKTTPD